MAILNRSLPMLVLFLLGSAVLVTPSFSIELSYESSIQEDDVGRIDMRAPGGVKESITAKEPVATRSTTLKSPVRNTTTSRPARLGWRKNCGRAPLHNNITGYIINAETANYGDFPSFARVKVVGSSNECGGTLISNRHVLTAAHCLKQKDKVQVILGDHNGLKNDGHEKVLNVSRACWSPNFAVDFPGIRHDWLVLELSKTVKFNNWIQPACMPRTLPKTSGEMSNCFLMGFGFSTFNASLADNPLNPHKAGITPETLQKIQVEQVTCDSRFDVPENDPSRSCYIFADRDRFGGSCYGDSGSPVLCTDSAGLWTVTAVVSNGKYSFCGFKSASAVQTIYTNVNKLLGSMDKHCKYLLVK